MIPSARIVIFTHGSGNLVVTPSYAISRDSAADGEIVIITAADAV